MAVHRVELHDGVMFNPGGTPIVAGDIVTHGDFSYAVPETHEESTHCGRIIRTWAIPDGPGRWHALSQVLEAS